jgi:hypothetical protein
MPANYAKTIVCLANSRKTGGRCVAGKERESNAWIRPVSARNTAEVSFDERQYENGKEPEILDVIEVSMVGPAPHGHQQENHMIDADYYWIKRGRAEWGEMKGLADDPQTLWGIGHSTNAGHNDRVPATQAAQYQTSLLLIQPQQVTISVQIPGAAFGNHKKAVRANFCHKGVWYNMKVTDFDVERLYLAKDVGLYPLEQPCYLCISLAEVHTDGYCYKLVATVITGRGL